MVCKCGGGGYIREGRFYNECDCRKEAKFKKKLYDSGVKACFWDKDFKDFDQETVAGTQCLVIAKGLYEKIKVKQYPTTSVCFWGKHNSGKSLLVSILALKLIRDGLNVAVLDLQGLNDIYFSKEVGGMNIDKLTHSADVLILELGSEFVNRIMGHLLLAVHKAMKESCKYSLYTSRYSIGEIRSIYGEEAAGLFSNSKEVTMVPLV